ncbi:MAG: GC-type dockerin domain-anchored protein [Phycisphaerales bacterium JB041]
MFRTAAATAALVCTLASVSSAQLLNPSFDDPGLQTTFDNWEQFGGNIFLVEDPNYQPPLDGTGCGKIYGNFDGQQQSDSGVYQSVAAAPGETYTATINVLHRSDDAMAGDNLALLILSWRDVNGAEILADAKTVLDANSPLDQWIEDSITATAPAGTVSVDFFVLFIQFANDEFPFGAPGAMFFDKASLDLDEPTCRVDINNDGRVNTQDFIDFLNLWSARNAQADWDGNGTVNTQDFILFLNEWVAGC